MPSSTSSSDPRPTGAGALIRTAELAGISVCFANPGTTELPLLTALEGTPALRAVLGLSEGVVTGGADGYARMSRRPALTIMHMGSGLGNGLANLHNAKRARSPVVNIVGDHPGWHRANDPPLASDIESIAGTVSSWVRVARGGDILSMDLSEAIAAAMEPPGGIATLIVPSDLLREPSAPASSLRPIAQASRPDPGRIEAAASCLRIERAALLLGGAGLQEAGLRAAARISRATGCRLLCETFPARLECGHGLPPLERVPYMPGPALAMLSQFDRVVIAGASRPVAFFAEPGYPGCLLGAQTSVEPLALPGEDATWALGRLADLFEGEPAARTGPPVLPGFPVPLPPAGSPLHAHNIMSTIAAAQPEEIIFVDEGISLGGAWLRVASHCPPHSYLSLTGGATGLGLSCAAGAAIACPGRRVVALVGDGSALYAPQALWTLAREGLDVIALVCANDGYRILQREIERSSGPPGPRARALTDFSNPRISWIDLARGFGVPASRVESSGELLAALSRAMATPGPHLIEMRLP